MPNPTRVVIVGAGFAGLAAAHELRDQPGVEVLLINRETYATFQPLLYQVATAGIDQGDVAHPVRGNLAANTGFRQAEVTSVDPAARTVTTSDGATIAYDHLVVSCGTDANFMGLPGAREHSEAIYSLADALKLRARIDHRLEQLAKERATGTLRIAIVGGGPTGVELAGQLAELRNRVFRRAYPELSGLEIKVTLIDGGSAVLKMFVPRIQRYAGWSLRKRGVDFVFGKRISGVTERAVQFNDGTELESHLTVWCAGVTVDERVAGWGVPQSKGGRITVDDTLRSIGDERIWAAGDVAADTNDPLPQLAQPALQQGAHVGRQILRAIAGQPLEPFHYRNKGTMATIGFGSAVVQLPDDRTSMVGPIAWLSWIGVHVVSLLGLRNRVSVLANLGVRALDAGNPSGLVSSSSAGDERGSHDSDGAPVGARIDDAANAQPAAQG